MIERQRSSCASIQSPKLDKCMGVQYNKVARAQSQKNQSIISNIDHPSKTTAEEPWKPWQSSRQIISNKNEESINVSLS